jgi:outer membrane protein assembly factor BamE (lipoprotein component of BamABCDE complex)
LKSSIAMLQRNGNRSARQWPWTRCPPAIWLPIDRIGPGSHSGKVYTMHADMRSLAARLGLSALLSLGLAGTVVASDISEQAAQQINIGTSEAAIRSQLGEPSKAAGRLFSSGEVWFYYLADSTPGDERVLQVKFDAQGNVSSTHLVNASQYSMDRLYSDHTD